MSGYTDPRRPLRAAAAALLVLGAAACGGGEGRGEAEVAEKAPDKVTVLGARDVAAAEMTGLAAGVALTGSLEPYRVAEVKAQVPGVVRGLSVDRGSGVRAGQVSERIANTGEAVNPGQTLLTVVNTQFLELRGQVPVDQANQVRAGQPAEFTLTAFPGRTFSGTVARIDPVADPGTRQVGVTLRLRNPGELIAGMFASGRVVTGGGVQALVVPAAAVRGQGAEQHVLVVQGDSVVRRPVTLGARDDARGVIAVQGGVQAGERVIVSPGMVPAGGKVRVQAAGAGAPAAAAPATGG